jgi:N-acetylmuramoyl-L-alanine amidase
MVYGMKRYKLLTLLFLCIAGILFPALKLQGQARKEFVVVIDPGHGGRDPGAVGGEVKEKDITLAIALKLGRQLATLENTKVIYTRTTDETVELYKRPQVANESKADLFISIHCNSVESNRPYGAETWVMGLHRSKANLEVARKENSVILLEDDYQTRYDGFDPNSPEGEIIFSLYQNAYLEQSVAIASFVQQELRTTAQRFDRGVKQAGFLVLWRINMPGILVEVGFLSNENERKYLVSDAGQNAIATSLFNSVVNYREKIEGVRPGVVASQPVSPPPTGRPAQPTQAARPSTASTPAPAAASAPASLPAPTPAAMHQPPAMSSTPEPAVAPNSGQPVEKPVVNLYFAVQFLSTSTQRPVNDPAFAGLIDVHMYASNGIYRYVSGRFQQLDQAVAHKNEMHKGVYRDAFVVAFYRGERITLPEAAELQKQQR